jgi:hypothetical protein
MRVLTLRDDVLGAERRSEVCLGVRSDCSSDTCAAPSGELDRHVADPSGAALGMSTDWPAASLTRS